MMRRLRLLPAAALLAALAAPAGAVVVSFGGTTAGTDPLGHSYLASNELAPSWGIPGLGLGTTPFNPGTLAPGDGRTVATEFRFAVLFGPDIDFTPPTMPDGYEETTRFSLDKGAGFKLWTIIAVSPQQVTFRARSYADRIEVGDEFFVNVVFKGGTVEPDEFRFVAAWDNTVVPEPRTWGMLIAGAGLVGVALRSRTARACEGA